jgi:hypothetical protein
MYGLASAMAAGVRLYVCFCMLDRELFLQDRGLISWILYLEYAHSTVRLTDSSI